MTPDHLKKAKIIALEIRRIEASIKTKKREFQGLKGQIFALGIKSKQLHTALVDEMIK